ncbi:MAG: NADP-dependent malic enzyme [Elusimicrobiaceae bacterium]|mgnify:FL=1|jgi:malate dehydrogenase (oxaloacetate-decarboxylating)|nr:NADP-dependent malic enzyme [Elusimicrobiaceae bacterium]MBT3955509.1 NADP-dependent malic enzyme [Elusimicrobiaceae bacterium]MBT4008535.1 NADP-dependent malic enzyme [Elusimicrobiaceae bacterium]MBT4402392.1 NADP-dependent malic enzyme [Elusimicrobiaceae bacterium]MBT4440348.1 NADP-dependent malic enzyme [Elusimicrobiaceae bacterium]
MSEIKYSLDNLDALFPKKFTEEQKATAQTVFLKKLSLKVHQFYKGKMMTVPKAGIYGSNWLNVYYTPGVSSVSTSIRDDNKTSFQLSNRNNLVAVVSDSTRVLGDGDCTPSGGLGVMEGKAFLMKYLGGVDAQALCIDSKNEKGENDPKKIIDFVKMVQHSFGAVNLEDISQPNCYEVLDTLRKESKIPVWHDDAQGTGCVTLAGLLGALKVVKKDISKIKIVLYGAGSSNTTIAELILEMKADPKNMILFDAKGSLNSDRKDLEKNKAYYKKWELCKKTNSKKIKTIEEAMKDADVLIALSKPGPNVVKKEWIKLMAKKPIVFACANPVPEIYPHQAKEAGAYIVATGRGDFENQVNNSLGFPGILKGALISGAKTITNGMAIAAAKSIAESAKKQGLSKNRIVPDMEDWHIFPKEAADVAIQAVKEGVATDKKTWKEYFKIAETDIKESRALIHHMMEVGFIKKPPKEMLESALKETLKEMK